VPGDSSNLTRPCNHWRLATRYNLPGGRPATRGLEGDWRLAARTEPPSGLDWFRLAALGLRQAMMLLLMTCVCCVLSNDAILGSRDVVP